MGDGTSRDGGGARRPRPVLERAVVHGGEQELHALRRSVGVRDQPARTRGHQPGVDRGDYQPDRQHRAGTAARGGLHPGHDRRRSGENPQSRNDLRPPQGDRNASARPVHGDGDYPESDPSAAVPRPPHLGAAGRDHRQRRLAGRRHPVPDQWSRPE